MGIHRDWGWIQKGGWNEIITASTWEISWFMSVWEEAGVWWWCMFFFFFLPAKEGTFKFESIWTSRNEKSIKKSLALVHLDPTSRISWMPHPVLFFPWGSILKQNITAKECGIIHIYIYVRTITHINTHTPNVLETYDLFIFLLTICLPFTQKTLHQQFPGIQT